MTFGQSISTCFSKYADFSGRASRSEYWWFYLFCLILNWGASIVDAVGGSGGFLSIAVILVTFLPQLAASARRLHDTGRSGWVYLLAFTCIGASPVIIWWASEGEKQANRFGPATTTTPA